MWMVLRILWGKLECIVWVIHLALVERAGNGLSLRSSILVERSEIKATNEPNWMFPILVEISEIEITMSIDQLRVRKITTV